jgi:hypothetical protein
MNFETILPEPREATGIIAPFFGRVGTSPHRKRANPQTEDNLNVHAWSRQRIPNDKQEQ